MPTTSTRPLTEPERLELQRLIAEAPTPAHRAKLARSNAMVMAGTLFAAVLAVWLVTAALVKAMTGADIGWGSGWRLPMLCGAAVASAAIAWVHSRGWVRGLHDPLPDLQADLATGLAEETRLVFSDALRFREPEHGGLVYFLKDDEGHPYVLYDHESQERGVRGEDPLGSGFAPRVHRVVVRGPRSREVLSARFDGQLLPLPAPEDLTAPPSAWPGHEERGPGAWDEVASHYGGPKR